VMTYEQMQRPGETTHLVATFLVFSLSVPQPLNIFEPDQRSRFL